MAIDDILDEHEQSERVRNWLRSNALGLIVGVGLGLGAIYGWTWWRDQQAAERVKAGDSYQALVKDVEAGKLDGAKTKAAGLKDSGYATLAALDLAKAQIDAGKRDDAIATLRAAKTSDSTLVPVVNQRLARLLIDAGKHDEALKLVTAADDAATVEVRGDAYFAQGKLEQARGAYTDALKKLDVAAPQRRLVELKLTQAGGKPPKADDAS
jgi:predicted negative regulator of RcsB-dependent stress response